MGRPLNRFELRAAVEAAEARGLKNKDEAKPRRAPKDQSTTARQRASAATIRTRVVWAVCDVGGRTVTTFDYANKADAEALIAKLKASGKGTHFLRSVKEPMV
jgi:hypothetical protein